MRYRSTVLLAATLAIFATPLLPSGSAHAEVADETKHHTQNSSSMTLHSCPAEIELVNHRNESMSYRIDLQFHENYAWGKVPAYGTRTIPLETMVEDRPEMVWFYDFRENGALGREWTKNCAPPPQANLQLASADGDCSTPQLTFGITNTGNGASDRWLIRTPDDALFDHGNSIAPGETVEHTFHIDPELSRLDIALRIYDSNGEFAGVGLGCPAPLRTAPGHVHLAGPTHRPGECASAAS